MNLQEILKQFKNIEPDASYAANSKRGILAHEPKMPWSVRRTILTIIETGAAVALTVFFIFIVLGSFSNPGTTPSPYAAIDPASLRAEAQAIDMQIQLAQLNYTESAAESTAPVTSMPASHPANAASLNAAATSSATSSVTQTPGAGANASSGASSTLSLDQALRVLSQ